MWREAVWKEQMQLAVLPDDSLHVRLVALAKAAYQESHALAVDNELTNQSQPMPTRKGRYVRPTQRLVAARNFCWVLQNRDENIMLHSRCMISWNSYNRLKKIAFVFRFVLTRNFLGLFTRVDVRCKEFSAKCCKVGMKICFKLDLWLAGTVFDRKKNRLELLSPKNWIYLFACFLGYFRLDAAKLVWKYTLVHPRRYSSSVSD